MNILKATFSALLYGGVIALINLTPLTITSANAASLSRAGAPAEGYVCRNVVTKSGKRKRLCRSKPRTYLSAITIYNRRHCHSGGLCHKHRFANPGHRH